MPTVMALALSVGTGWGTRTVHPPRHASPRSEQANAKERGARLWLSHSKQGCENFWVHFRSSQQLIQANLQVKENLLPSLVVSQGVDKT